VRSEEREAEVRRRGWHPERREVDEPSRPTMYYRIDVATYEMLQKDFGSPAGPAFRIQLTGGTGPTPCLSGI
jgi:hypothetical protein